MPTNVSNIFSVFILSTSLSFTYDDVILELEEEEDDNNEGEEDSKRAEGNDDDSPDRVVHRHPQRHVVLVHHALSTIHA